MTQTIILDDPSAADEATTPAVIERALRWWTDVAPLRLNSDHKIIVIKGTRRGR